jgi:hypothetical protein
VPNADSVPTSLKADMMDVDVDADGVIGKKPFFVNVASNLA